MKKVYTFYIFLATIYSLSAQEEVLSTEFLRQQAWVEGWEEAVEQADSVYKLDASSLGLREFPEQAWELSNLRWLNLKDNDFTGLPIEFAYLGSLTRLSIAANNFTELPEVLGQLEFLTYIDISSNEELEVEMALMTLSELANLKELRMRELSIQEIPDPLLEIKGLRYLDISLSADLQFLSPQLAELSELQSLELMRMQLDWDSSFVVLAGLPQLRYLGLDNNDWESLPPGLYQLEQIQALSLEYNQLTSLPERLKDLPNLEIIYLKGNPIPEAEQQDLQENWGNQIKLQFEPKEDRAWR